VNARVAFDTHAFVKRLEAAGVRLAHAEALADAMGHIVLQSIATKTDLRELELSLREDLKDLELRLTTRMGIMIATSTTLTVGLLGALNLFS
jgi:hypothetical protein